jgi:2-polyprenyl-3-methyl-5-hydroxy-6-metoxy-1,4-benzoquinol methylase
MNDERGSEQVLSSEQAFFDEEAAALRDEDLMIPADQMERYRHAQLRSANTPKDTLFSLLGPLEGKRVLEYGCGLGEDSCHLADRGAIVTALDLSPVSIQKARRRAELLGLSDRITFDVKAAGDTGYAPGAFDIVMGIAILHHLHQDLHRIYSEVDRLLKPDGVAFFTEPVANSAVLRGLRPLVPVPRHATPDERQLQYTDLELMKQYGFSRIDYFHFHLFGRLKRVLGYWSEQPLRRLDSAAQRVAPFLKPLYGIVIVRARR